MDNPKVIPNWGIYIYVKSSEGIYSPINRCTLESSKLLYALFNCKCNMAYSFYLYNSQTVNPNNEEENHACHAGRGSRFP